MYEPRRPPRHETLRLRGLEHHLTRWGPESKTPLVFLHGFLDVSDTFQFVIDAFARDWPVLALDWRGFGRSAFTGQPYWFPDYLADLEALLSATCDGPATLIGHSMGGNVACLYAGVRPGRVARVVNLEGIGLMRRKADEAPGRYREWLDQLEAPKPFSRYPTLQAFAAELARRNPRVRADRLEFIAGRWARPLPEGGVSVGADPYHRLVNPVLYRRDEAEACWAAGEAPVLLLLGGQSPFRDHLEQAGELKRFQALFRSLEVITLEDCGHMMHHEDPEAVARAIEPFLTA